MPVSKSAFDVAALVERSTSGRCFVCEFLRGTSDYEHVLIAQTETCVAFLNRYPTLFGYVIVAPRQHVEQVTADFTEAQYLELQRFVFRVAEGVRRVLSPERIYILSLGSQAANAHVHWHIAPLPHGVPLEQQQYHALMHENGVVASTDAETQTYADELRRVLAPARE